jgi:hypothetical protein
MITMMTVSIANINLTIVSILTLVITKINKKYQNNNIQHNYNKPNDKLTKNLNGNNNDDVQLFVIIGSFYSLASFC